MVYFAGIGQVMLAREAIGATLSATVPSQLISSLVIRLISATTAGRSIAVGYFNYRSLLEMRIRQGQELKFQVADFGDLLTNASCPREKVLNQPDGPDALDAFLCTARPCG